MVPKGPPNTPVRKSRKKGPPNRVKDQETYKNRYPGSVKEISRRIRPQRGPIERIGMLDALQKRFAFPLDERPNQQNRAKNQSGILENNKYHLNQKKGPKGQAGFPGPGERI